MHPLSTEIRVPVSQGHLTRGKRRHCERCPLALALGDYLRAAGHPSFRAVIGNWHASAVDAARLVAVWDLDAGTRGNIATFDAQGPVAPWTAVLTPARDAR